MKENRLHNDTVRKRKKKGYLHWKDQQVHLSKDKCTSK